MAQPGALPSTTTPSPRSPPAWWHITSAPDGKVTPRLICKGFESFSFGQKKQPSAWVTARLCVVLRRVEEMAGEIADVDVQSLTSSKGGAGIARPAELDGVLSLPYGAAWRPTVRPARLCGGTK